MSIYVMPIASSLLIWLILMVEIPGVVTTPMDRELGDASEALSDGLCLLRQAITHGKPQGGVTGQMTANSHTGKEGLDGMGVSCRVAEGLDGSVWVI